jgi:putative transposase
MPRSHLYKSSFLPYHVTARTNNREDFPLTKDQVWKIIGNECLFLSLIYEVEFHGVVLMPNHFHMMLTVPHQDLGIVMNHFMRSVSRTINLLSGRSGHVFGGPHYRSLINNSRYFGHALKYIYRNPVRAKLCSKVEDYPYSSIQGLIGLTRLPFPIFFTRVGMEASLPLLHANEQLAWLNTPFPKEAEPLIQRGLRRTLFDVVMDRKTRQPSDLLMTLL